MRISYAVFVVEAYVLTAVTRPSALTVNTLAPHAVLEPYPQLVVQPKGSY